MATLKLTLEYDGAAFSGWQQQAGGEQTVAGCLDAACLTVLREPVRVMGAGRTDAGVHAEGQVASLDLPPAASARFASLGPQVLLKALNANCPAEMAITRLEVAEDGFDARRSALGKRYRYQIWNGPIRAPLRARRSYAFKRSLGAAALAAMQHAANDLVGEHDFASFQAAGSSVVTTQRALWRLDVSGEPGGEIVCVVEGGGFLRHMVRNLVGTLLEVGAGRRAPDSMPTLLAARDRRAAGPTAPAHGLSLVRVWYPGDPLPDGFGPGRTVPDETARGTAT